MAIRIIKFTRKSILLVVTICLSTLIMVVLMSRWQTLTVMVNNQPQEFHASGIVLDIQTHDGKVRQFLATIYLYLLDGAVEISEGQLLKSGTAVPVTLKYRQLDNIEKIRIRLEHPEYAPCDILLKSLTEARANSPLLIQPPSWVRRMANQSVITLGEVERHLFRMGRVYLPSLSVDQRRDLVETRIILQDLVKYVQRQSQLPSDRNKVDLLGTFQQHLGVFQRNLYAEKN